MRKTVLVFSGNLVRLRGTLLEPSVDYRHKTNYFYICFTCPKDVSALYIDMHVACVLVQAIHSQKAFFRDWRWQSSHVKAPLLHWTIDAAYACEYRFHKGNSAQARNTNRNTSGGASIVKERRNKIMDGDAAGTCCSSAPALKLNNKKLAGP